MFGVRLHALRGLPAISGFHGLPASRAMGSASHVERILWRGLLLAPSLGRISVTVILANFYDGPGKLPGDLVVSP